MQDGAEGQGRQHDRRDQDRKYGRHAVSENAVYLIAAHNQQMVSKMRGLPGVAFPHPRFAARAFPTWSESHQPASLLPAGGQAGAPPHGVAPRRDVGRRVLFPWHRHAPHPVADKETARGCAGIFNAPAALECYARVFAEEDALDRLAAFAALNGARFYGLPVNQATVTLEAAPMRVPESVSVAGPDNEIRPFLAGEDLGWRVVDTAR